MYCRYKGMSESRVPMTGMFDENLPLVRTCQVVRTAQLLTLVTSSFPAFRKYDKIRMNRRCLLIYRVGACGCVPTNRLYLTSGQVSEVHHSVRQVAKYTSLGNGMTMSKQLARVPDYKCVPYEPTVGTA